MTRPRISRRSAILGSVAAAMVPDFVPAAAPSFPPLGGVTKKWSAITIRPPEFTFQPRMNEDDAEFRDRIKATFAGCLP